MKYKKEILFMVIGMVFFGTATPVSKYISAEIPSFIASFLRVFIAAAILTPFLIKDRKKILNLKRKSWFYLLLVSVVGTFLFTLSLFEGSKRLSGVYISILMSFVPIATGFGAILFFNNKLTFRKLISLLLAVIGVVIINLSDTNISFDSLDTQLILGIILILTAIISEAVFTLGGKKISQELNVVTITGLASWISVLCFLPLAISQLNTFDIENLSFSNFVSLLWWGLGTLAFGTIFWYQGIKKAKAINASIFMSVMPVSALIFSYIILDENFKMLHLPAIALVVSAIIIFNKK